MDVKGSIVHFWYCCMHSSGYLSGCYYSPENLEKFKDRVCTFFHTLICIEDNSCHSFCFSFILTPYEKGPSLKGHLYSPGWRNHCCQLPLVKISGNFIQYLIFWSDSVIHIFPNLCKLRPAWKQYLLRPVLLDLNVPWISGPSISKSLEM